MKGPKPRMMPNRRGPMMAKPRAPMMPPPPSPVGSMGPPTGPQAPGMSGMKNGGKVRESKAAERAEGKQPKSEEKGEMHFRDGGSTGQRRTYPKKGQEMADPYADGGKAGKGDRREYPKRSSSNDPFLP